VEEPAEALGYRPRRGQKNHPGWVCTRDHTKIRELFADERCSKAILVFLATRSSAKRQAHWWKKKQAVRSQREREKHLALMAEEETRLGGENRRLICFPLSGGASYVRHLRQAAGRRLNLSAALPPNHSHDQLVEY